MGTPACFVRLAGCNLWSGLETSRGGGKGQCALWCDTYFRGGKTYTPTELRHILMRKMAGWTDPLVVITGGEPLLQLRKPDGTRLVSGLLDDGADVAIETNGTIWGDVVDMLNEHPRGHITVSPKPLIGFSFRGLNAETEQSLEHVVVRKGTDLKVIVPTPFDLSSFAEWEFEHRFLQPMDIHHVKDDNRGEISGLPVSSSPFRVARSLAEQHGWRVSVQTHKLLGLP